MSEIPRSSSSVPAKKTSAKKSPAKKTAAKKTAAKKTAAKKSPAKKAAAKKSPAEKSSTATKSKSSKNSSTRKRRSSRSPAKKAGRQLRKTSKDAQKSRFFKQARKRAAGIIDSPEKLMQLAADSSKTAGSRSGPLSEVLDDLKAMIRLVVAYSRGDYREISTETLVLVVAGLIYVAMPVDLIPDFIPVAGYADDVVVVGWVLKQVRDELHTFRDWEARQAS